MIRSTKVYMDNKGKFNNVIAIQLHYIKNYTLTVSRLIRYNVYTKIFRIFAGARLDLDIEQIPKLHLFNHFFHHFKILTIFYLIVEILASIEYRFAIYDI